MIRIKLVPEIDFNTNMIVKVMDFPSNSDNMASGRQRCKITVEYSHSDIEILKGRGMDMPSVLEYYRDWVYNVVRINLSQDWQCIGGMDEVLNIIEGHISDYF